MQRADVIFGFYADSAPFRAALARFARPTVYIGMPAGPGVRSMASIEKAEPSPLIALARQHGVDPIRIGCLGFSIGCAGVRACIASTDGPKIDVAMAIDGIHTSWTDQRHGVFSSADLLAWQAYARAATQDGRLCVISTSSIVPPSFVSTTITSDWIWQAATGSTAPGQDEPGPPPVLEYISSPPYVVAAGRSKDGSYRWPETTYVEAPVARYREKGGLVVFNYRNLDPSGHDDHIYQAQVVLPLLMDAYWRPRWDRTDPATGACQDGGMVAGVRRRAS